VGFLKSAISFWLLAFGQAKSGIRPQRCVRQVFLAKN
jgi:hypothetical protein